MFKVSGHYLQRVRVIRKTKYPTSPSTNITHLSPKVERLIYLTLTSKKF